MSRRKLIILVAIVTVVGVAAAGWWALVPRSPINEENFQRIEKGMMLARVEEILGGPTRDESTGKLLAYVTDEEAEHWMGRGAPNHKVARIKVAATFMSMAMHPEYEEQSSSFAVWKSNDGIDLLFFGL